MKDHFIIGSGDLSAVVLAPESPDYARTRFNHSAFIPDVIFKNVHFGQPEQVDPAKPTTKGAGLCCELICPDAEKSVSVGEEYVKPGIGYVRRVEKPWFFTDNPPYRPFETSVSAQSDRILFVTETEEVVGIAYRECRLLKAEGNTLSLSVHFENLGEKPLDMLEFCHNFISLGVLQTGVRHHLALPCVINPQPDPATAHMIGEPGGVTWPATGGGFFNVFTNVRRPEGYAWKLTHEDSPVAMSETVDFTPVRLTVWGLEHVISPEVFHRISLQSGESADWTRTWAFEA